MPSITLTSPELDETFTFTMPSDGGYVRVGDGKGDYNQIFKSNGAAITAYSEDELRKRGEAYVRRCIQIKNDTPDPRTLTPPR